MSDVFEDQRKFMRACGQTIDTPNAAQFKLYCDLIKEEVAELADAVANNDRVEQLDALIDIMVVTAGALHSMGVDSPGAWKEVMRSNFAKVDQRPGKVIRREDGKILKSNLYFKPNIEKILK